MHRCVCNTNQLLLRFIRALLLRLLLQLAIRPTTEISTRKSKVKQRISLINRELKIETTNKQQLITIQTLIYHCWFTRTVPTGVYRFILTDNLHVTRVSTSNRSIHPSINRSIDLRHYFDLICVCPSLPTHHTLSFIRIRLGFIFRLKCTAFLSFILTKLRD